MHGVMSDNGEKEVPSVLLRKRGHTPQLFEGMTEEDQDTNNSIQFNSVLFI